MQENNSDCRKMSLLGVSRWPWLQLVLGSWLLMILYWAAASILYISPAAPPPHRPPQPLARTVPTPTTRSGLQTNITKKVHHILFWNKMPLVMKLR